MKLLVRHLPRYNKHIKFRDFAAKVEAAVERARRLDRDAEAMREAGRNPTSGVYKLLDSISVRPAL